MTKSFGFYCTRFVIYSVAVILMSVAIIWGAYAFAPDLAATFFQGGSGTGMGIVTVLLPAMLVAQQFYKHEQRRMTSGEGWSMAFVFTVLTFAVSAAMIWVGTLIVPLTDVERGTMADMWNNDSQLLMMIAGGFAVFLILVIKLMLWSGVRGEIKKAERLAAKAARKA
ncbi:ABZJ_00895 family protein [Octadecabacter sp. 1_MG-2023]|uniref:ABZJ_00895 family protein n=1 Tax=unclassified Octadecabacter TaxID=196158 RepID=UPI001C08E686|nr:MULTISPECIES: ABZJ_00895 family protein [unclassified Octadecabacter]MBU2994549.1 ABZJ_00895 family protein [Octadecabacter sp. B2R22]MDO6734158.1 ABZJ_00895 family protein [Octadecabacter sp. 1_MG-2023]